MEIVQQWVNHHALNLIGIFVIILLAYFIGTRLVGILVKRVVKSTRHREWHTKDIEKRQKTLSGLFRSIWKIVIALAGLYSVLHEIFPNLDTTLAPLFASAGIIGIALGFGAQSLIKDFLGGIFIIADNEYRVGDIIEIEGFSGAVERIGTRLTIIRDAEGNVHYFPNGMIQHVVNKTMGYSMARFTLLVVPSTDIDELIDIIDQVGIKLAAEQAWKAKIITPPAFVSLGDITGNATEVVVAGKTMPSDQWAVAAEMRRRLLEVFEDKGIKLAIMPSLAQQKRVR